MTRPIERQIVVVADAATLAKTAAERLIARIDAADGTAAACLAGGSTPKALYELLATPDYARRIPWQRVHWFVGDDRFVPQDDPLSNIGMARRVFLDACAAPGTVHPIATGAASPDIAAARYEAELKSFAATRAGRTLFDIVLTGVGPDGHTASIFPGFSAEKERAHWVVGVPNAHVAPFVPRVTLTLPALAMTDEMLFLVAGSDKRAVVAQALAGNTLPASRARANGDTVWLLDKAAAPETAR